METPVPETAPQSIHPPEEAIAVVGSLVYMVGVYGCVGLLLYGALNLWLIGLMIGAGVLRGKPQFCRDVEYISATMFILKVGFLVCLGSNYLVGWPREIQNTPQTIREQLFFLLVMSAIVYSWYTVRRPDVRACFESTDPPLKASQVLYDRIRSDHGSVDNSTEQSSSRERSTARRALLISRHAEFLRRSDRRAAYFCVSGQSGSARGFSQ